MNYYERHLGDYARDTAHLSMMEHGAYNLLLDRYYATEQGIPADQVHRLARARTREERAAVDTVLQEFFALQEGVWTHKRADDELVKAQARIKAARDNGRRGGRPKQNPEEPSGLWLGSVLETQVKAHQSPDTNHQTVKQNPLPPTGVGATFEPPADPPAKVHEFPPGFDRFWQAYPRKTAKPQAAKAFARLRPDEPLLLRMLAALALQRQSAQWQRDDGQFIPHPSTWLNGRRWEDEGAQTDDAFAGAV